VAVSDALAKGDRMSKQNEENGPEPDDLESMKDRTHDLETDLADSRDLMDSMRDPVLVLDAELRVVSANRAYCTTFELKLKQVEGKLLVELGGGQWDIPELKKMLNEVLEKDTSFDGFEVDREFDKIGRRIMLLNARRIDRWPGKPHRIVLVMEDATTSRMAKNAAEESEAFHRALLENVTDAVFLADDSGRIVYVGGSVQEIFKKSAEEIQELDNIDGLLGKDLFDPEELSRKGEIATRRLRVVKYRGSGFGRNEYPYVITSSGFHTAPISTVGLRHKPLGEKITTGIARLDNMLHGGYRRSSCILLAGLPGAGKTILASSFVHCTCGQGGDGLVHRLRRVRKVYNQQRSECGSGTGTAHRLRPACLPDQLPRGHRRRGALFQAIDPHRGDVSPACVFWVEGEHVPSHPGTTNSWKVSSTTGGGR